METQRLRLTLPAELEDELVATLWEHGTLGVEVGEPDSAGDLSLYAYFPIEQTLPELGAGWTERGVWQESAERLAPQDWLASYRAHTVPFAVGDGFFIDPRDPADEPPPTPVEVPVGRRLLRLPAREAFGVGSHETTRLTLMLLEEAATDSSLAGARVLDVGTGTGILAFAALALGASQVTAFDIDPIAVFHARHNAVLNGEHVRADRAGAPPLALFAGTAAALKEHDRSAKPWDLLLVNVLPERIGADLEPLVRSLRDGGQLILSGLLTEQEAATFAALHGFGLVEVGRRIEGEWLGLCLRKESVHSGPGESDR